MSKVYELTWTASGTAEIEAESAEQAEEVLSEALLGMDLPEVDSHQVDEAEAYAQDDDDRDDIVAEERALRVV